MKSSVVSKCSDTCERTLSDNVPESETVIEHFLGKISRLNTEFLSYSACKRLLHERLVSATAHH